MTVDYYYVPLDDSLVSDAPGYGEAPVCWKCRNNTSKQVLCKICHGVGRLAPRKVVDRPGKITRGRRSREGEHPETKQKATLPLPAGYSFPLYGPIVQTCTKECTDHAVGSLEQTETASAPTSIKSSESKNNAEPQSSPPPPVWWPQTNEELCNLTGNGWRLLQRVRSHRWTTDDIVTAAVAVRQCCLHDRTDIQSYLDLGCGNGSVLQMVLSQCKTLPQTAVVGVEARSEAVSLARRSLVFNLGPQNPVQIHHADFRGFSDSAASSLQSFDLITGTPPYFAVGRHGGANQGGMPSALQSAPARCEFRGGFEAYCVTARRCIGTSAAATFVVCENYLNHDRALLALRTHGWTVREVLIVRGKLGREPLFVVYTASRRCPGETKDENESIMESQQRELAVRDLNGEWTEEYKNEILRFMSIL